MIKQILLVDDDEDEPAIFSAALEDTGISFQCTWAANADEALRYLENYKPDYIFLDFNMPKITGLELLRIIKADETIRDIPVIMYSATMDATLIRKAIDAGALKCIRKPYQMKDLPSILKTFL